MLTPYTPHPALNRQTFAYTQTPRAQASHFWSQTSIIFYNSVSLCWSFKVELGNKEDISQGEVKRLLQLSERVCVCYRKTFEVGRSLHRGLLEGDLHSPEVWMLLIIFFIFCRVRWSISRDCNESVTLKKLWYQWYISTLDSVWSCVTP